jgi:hypothetical protein
MVAKAIYQRAARGALLGHQSDLVIEPPVLEPERRRLG